MSDTNDQGSMTVSGPSSNPGSQSPNGNGGGSGSSKNNSSSHSNQAVAVMGAPIAIRLIDDVWGFTLNTVKSLSAEVEGALAKVLSSAPSVGTMAELGLRTGLWGLAIQSVLPGKIAPDDPAYNAHIVNVTPASTVTNQTPEQIAASTDVAVHAQIQDSVEDGQQTIGVVTAPGRILSTPVVTAKPTAVPNVFSAKIHDDMPAIQIKIDQHSSVTPTSQSVTKSVSVSTPSEATISPGGNTTGAIVHFPKGNYKPVYVSVTKVLTPAQIKSLQAEVKKRQQEWDARHPVEVANKKLKVAKSKTEAAKKLNDAAQSQLSVSQPNLAKAQKEYDDAEKSYEVANANAKRYGDIEPPQTSPNWFVWVPAHIRAENARKAMVAAQDALAKAKTEANSAPGRAASTKSAYDSAVLTQQKAEDDAKKAESDDKKNPKEKEFKLDDKIRGQMPLRGWTEKGIEDAINNGPAGLAVDQRSPKKTDDGRGRNDPATVYGSRGKYVIINDRTGEVTAISDKTDPGWVDDSRIVWGNNS